MSQTFYKKGFLALAVAAALGVSTFVQADVKIGVAGPMTGANASFGEQYMKGAQAAADALNKTGGINGEKIVLVAGDDACEPKQAVAVANRLADQDKVIGVVGHFCSSNTIPASEVYDEAGIIAITPGSTNPQVTERGLGAIHLQPDSIRSSHRGWCSERGCTRAPRVGSAIHSGAQSNGYLQRHAAHHWPSRCRYRHNSRERG